MAEIGTLIAEYGIVPAVVCVLMYLLIIWQNKRLENKRIEAESKKEQEKIAAQAKADAEREQRDNERELRTLNMFKEALTEAMRPTHTVKEQQDGHKLNELIDAQLDELTNACPACRSYLFTFHNGGSDIIGRGFLKMSLTNEYVKPGCTPIMKKYQNLPRGLFPRLYTILEKEEHYDIKDIEDIKDSDLMTYAFLSEHNVHAAFFRPIKRSDGLMLGFVGTEFLDKVTDDHVTKHAYRSIDARTNRIVGAILGSSDDEDTTNNPLIK